VVDGTPTKTHYRVSEAAEFLGVSRSKLYMLMDSGALTYIKLGKCRRIAAGALKDLVARHTVGAQDTPAHR
jgi:excisionase family DNA binding protein